MELISYLAHCLTNDKIIRWPETCMPLKVYIAPFRWYKAKNESYKYQYMIHKSLESWQTASSGKVTFKIVNSINESQINIDWRRVDRSSLGDCNFSFDKLGRLYSAEITIGLSDGILHAKYQDENEVLHTIIHEIGHSIGLKHSPYKNDIMYVPHQYGVTTISNSDKQTIKWLYSVPYGMNSQEILVKKGFSSNYNLDQMIYKLENNDSETAEFNKDNLIVDNAEEILVEEQKILADINKYNVSLQNISVSSDLKEYIKKTMIDKNNTGKHI